MGYHGLSEQWLKRRAGDLHWRLIARAMGQRDAVFICPDGEPLYAAFCATSLKIFEPDAPRLGGNLVLSSDLYRVGHGRLASCVEIAAEDRIIGRMVLVSAFVGRTVPESNRSIVRRSPKALAMPPEADISIKRIAGVAATLARSALQKGPGHLVGTRRQDLLPCPATDFNAAGLLYFPSFSALADRALFQSGERDCQFITSRQVIYLGNVEPGEWIGIGLRKISRGYDVFLHGSDDRPLALMRARFR